MILRRDNLAVMLSLASRGTIIVPHWKVNPGRWNAYFWVDEVDALFAEFKGAAPGLIMAWRTNHTTGGNSAFKTWTATISALASSGTKKP